MFVYIVKDQIKISPFPGLLFKPFPRVSHLNVLMAFGYGPPSEIFLCARRAFSDCRRYKKKISQPSFPAARAKAKWSNTRGADPILKNPCRCSPLNICTISGNNLSTAGPMIGRMRFSFCRIRFQSRSPQNLGFGGSSRDIPVTSSCVNRCAKLSLLSGIIYSLPLPFFSCESPIRQCLSLLF